eukprot:g8321.t1
MRMRESCTDFPDCSQRACRALLMPLTIFEFQCFILLPSEQCYRLPDIDAEKGLSAYVGICNWFRFEETAGASDAPTLLVERVKKAGSDLARRPASWLKRNVLKTENLELCVNDETASIGFLYFDKIDSSVVNGQTLSDPLDTRTGITRAAFLAATSSKRDPGGFFPYQSNDVVDRDDIPLCYVVVGKTSDNKFYGITLLVRVFLLVNHYICDGSTYFRLLIEFDELIITHRQWSNQRVSPKQLVSTLLGPLCDFALAAVRNPDLYRCVLVKLTDQELKKLKQNYANAVSTNDAVFALATELPAEEAAYVQHTAVSFPLDQRGVFSPFTDMLGNATRTVRANRASKDSLQAPLLLNSATPGESPKATTRLDMDSRAEILKTSSTSLGLPSVVPLSHLILSKLKSSLASVLVALFLPKKLPVALQHVSWAKVQYSPKGVLCQKPIQLDEDPKLVLRKMHHHGSLLTQFDSTVYTLRFCHRKAVVSHMLAEIAKVKSSVGGVSGAAAQENSQLNISGSPSGMSEPHSLYDDANITKRHGHLRNDSVDPWKKEPRPVLLPKKGASILEQQGRRGRLAATGKKPPENKSELLSSGSRSLPAPDHEIENESGKKLTPKDHSVGAGASIPLDESLDPSVYSRSAPGSSRDGRGFSRLPAEAEDHDLDAGGAGRQPRAEGEKVRSDDEPSEESGAEDGDGASGIQDGALSMSEPEESASSTSTSDGHEEEKASEIPDIQIVPPEEDLLGDRYSKIPSASPVDKHYSYRDTSKAHENRKTENLTPERQRSISAEKQRKAVLAEAKKSASAGSSKDSVSDGLGRAPSEQSSTGTVSLLGGKRASPLRRSYVRPTYPLGDLHSKVLSAADKSYRYRASSAAHENRKSENRLPDLQRAVELSENRRSRSLSASDKTYRFLAPSISHENRTSKTLSPEKREQIAAERLRKAVQKTSILNQTAWKAARASELREQRRASAAERRVSDADMFAARHVRYSGINFDLDSLVADVEHVFSRLENDFKLAGDRDRTPPLVNPLTYWRRIQDRFSEIRRLEGMKGARDVEDLHLKSQKYAQTWMSKTRSAVKAIKEGVIEEELAEVDEEDEERRSRAASDEAPEEKNKMNVNVGKTIELQENQFAGEVVLHADTDASILDGAQRDLSAEQGPTATKAASKWDVLRDKRMKPMLALEASLRKEREGKVERKSRASEGLELEREVVNETDAPLVEQAAAPRKQETTEDHEQQQKTKRSEAGSTPYWDLLRNRKRELLTASRLANTTDRKPPGAKAEDDVERGRCDPTNESSTIKRCGCGIFATPRICSRSCSTGRRKELALASSGLEAEGVENTIDKNKEMSTKDPADEGRKMWDRLRSELRALTAFSDAVVKSQPDVEPTAPEKNRNKAPNKWDLLRQQKQNIMVQRLRESADIVEKLETAEAEAGGQLSDVAEKTEQDRLMTRLSTCLADVKKAVAVTMAMRKSSAITASRASAAESAQQPALQPSEQTHENVNVQMDESKTITKTNKKPDKKKMYDAARKVSAMLKVVGHLEKLVDNDDADPSTDLDALLASEANTNSTDQTNKDWLRRDELQWIWLRDMLHSTAAAEAEGKKQDFTSQLLGMFEGTGKSWSAFLANGVGKVVSKLSGAGGKGSTAQQLDVDAEQAAEDFAFDAPELMQTQGSAANSEDSGSLVALPRDDDDSDAERVLDYLTASSGLDADSKGMRNSEFFSALDSFLEELASGKYKEMVVGHYHVQKSLTQPSPPNKNVLVQRDGRAFSNFAFHRYENLLLEDIEDEVKAEKGMAAMNEASGEDGGRGKTMSVRVEGLPEAEKFNFPTDLITEKFDEAVQQNKTWCTIFRNTPHEATEDGRLKRVEYAATPRWEAARCRSCGRKLHARRDTICNLFSKKTDDLHDVYYSSFNLIAGDERPTLVDAEDNSKWFPDHVIFNGRATKDSQ